MSQSTPPSGVPRDDSFEIDPGTTVRVTDDGIREVGFDDPELRPLPPDKLRYHVPHADAHPESHEHSDVPIRPLAITLAAIAGTCVLTFVLLYFVFWQFKGQQQAQERPRTAITDVRPDVPEPRIQGVPGFSNHHTDDLKELKADYERQLDGYATNDGTQTARIPIKDAMDLALQRKMFPVAQPGATQPTTTRQGRTNPAGGSNPATPRGGGQ